MIERNANEDWTVFGGDARSFLKLVCGKQNSDMDQGKNV
jgi:hypothetical protein